MGFEDDQHFEIESYTCSTPECKGNIIETEKGIWECDTCDFHVNINEDCL